MTTGALLFAFDSEIQYTKLAVECARRIKKHLGIPVTLVTDKPVDSDMFDSQVIVDRGKNTNRRYFHDRKETTTWYNFGRNAALDLSPYDRTLLVDTDYMVNSDSLAPLLDSSQPFLCHRHVRSIHQPLTRLQTFGTKNSHMWWATVVIFDRHSQFTQDVFDIWKMVEQNYAHYGTLFGFNTRQYRNDFAISIALLLANGNTHPHQCEIPWPMANVETDVEIDLVDNTWWIEYINDKRKKKICVKNHDLHVMCKSYLEKLYAVRS